MDGPSYTYTVCSIPPIPGHHHIVQYKELRLSAVKFDPQAFSSTYERESTLSYEQWKARLQSQDKVTIVAAAQSQSSERLSWQNKWVGTVTVLGHKVLKAFRFVPPTSPSSSPRGNHLYYLFVGLWVHSTHRGKGLAKQMIGEGLEWIRKDVQDLNSTMPIHVLLQVARNNQPAIGLYLTMGFQLLKHHDERTAEDENIWMGMYFKE